MKQFISVKFLMIVFAILTFSVTAQAQYGQYGEDDRAGIFINASFGMAMKAEKVFEMEAGIKSEHTKLFFSIPAMIYTARDEKDRRTHFYYGIRVNYLFYMSELTAISPMASYLRHITGEEGRNSSNDFDAGIRFYRFAANPGARSAAWTVTAKYLHTKANVYEPKGLVDFVPANRFVISVGIHGLF